MHSVSQLSTLKILNDSSHKFEMKTFNRNGLVSKIHDGCIFQIKPFRTYGHIKNLCEELSFKIFSVLN